MVARTGGPRLLRGHPMLEQALGTVEQDDQGGIYGRVGLFRMRSMRVFGGDCHLPVCRAMMLAAQCPLIMRVV